MAMTSDDIIHHMACDLSQNIDRLVKNWPLPNEPADAYTDSVRAVFGKKPTAESVAEYYKSGVVAQALRHELNNRFETSVLDEQTATSLLEILIKNKLGPEFLKEHRPNDGAPKPKTCK
ncbi:MAG: hypothetical protein ACK56W_12355 [Pirellula sp.]|jgi:hypothetical protein|nr:hypothetical protein [Pirellula sp.]